MLRVLCAIAVGLAWVSAGLAQSPSGAGTEETQGGRAGSNGSRLDVSGARIESPAGDRFCVGDQNRVFVDVRRKGSPKLEQPVRIVLQKWVAPGVAGGGTSRVVPEEQTRSARMSVAFDRVRVTEADRASGYFDIQVWEGPSPRAGGTLRLDIGPSTDWSSECAPAASE